MDLFPWKQEAEPGLSGAPRNSGGLFPWKEEQAPQETDILRQAVTKNPDESARVRRLSINSNRDIPSVEANPQAVEADLRTNELVSQTSSLPTTRKTISNPDYAPIVHDSVRELGVLETLGRSFNRGAATRAMGLVGYDYLRNPSPETKEAVDRAKQRLAEMGHTETDGFFSYVDSAAETLGQMTSGFTDSNFAGRVAAGAATGAAPGLLFGPASPLAAGVGSAVGAGAGAVSFFVEDSFKQEAGGAYVEMIDEGIESDVARPLALGVGAINAGLETLSLSVVAAPFAQGVKTLLKTGANQAARSPAVMSAARQFATAYAGGIASEVVTEGTQELVQIIAAEWGKQMSDMDLESITTEEAVERISGVMEQTFKAMTILAAPGPAFRWATNNRNAQKAHEDFALTEEISSEMPNTPAFERAPDIVAEHIAEAMKTAGIEQAYISGPEFIEWLNQQDNPEQTAVDLGIQDQLEDIIDLGINAEIPISAFNKSILSASDYNSLKEHVKFYEDGMTEFEAKEWEGTKLSDVVEETSLVEDDPVLADASAELGLFSMFKDAKDAGLTDKQYAAYLRSIENAQNESKKRLQDAALRAELNPINAEYKKQMQRIEAESTESVGTLPVYQATNNLQHDKLDRDLSVAILNGNAKLKDFPKQEGRFSLFAERGTNGIDPDLYAELHGYDNAESMFLDMLTSPTYKEAVVLEVERRAKTEIPELMAQRDKLIQARLALLNEPILDMLTNELNIMRNAITVKGEEGKKPKNASAKMIKQRAQERIRNMKVKDINPAKFLQAAKKYGKATGVSLKTRTTGKGVNRQKIEGDRTVAAQNKYLQVLNYAMAIEASRIQKRLERQKNFLNRVSDPDRKTRLPVTYRDAIQEVLESVRFKGPVRIKSNPFKNLKALANDPQDPVDVPERYTDRDGRVSYQLISVDEFNRMYDLVREIHKKGMEENKLRNQERAKDLNYATEILAVQISDNIKNISKSPDQLRQGMGKLVSRTQDAVMLLFNMDTLVRELDGFKDLGLAYEYFKAPYDTAISKGYLPGQRGLLTRQVEAAKAMNDIFSVFSKKEKADMNKLITVPGVNRKLSHQTVLSVILNLGNADNKKALTNRSFSEQEVGAVLEYASKKDFDFAQSIWDYFDTYWDEIVETNVRRRNVRPKKVKAQELVTKHGTYKGGYYPIAYKNEASISNTSQDVDAEIQSLRYGRFLSYQTAHGHTERRVQGGADREISTDLFVIQKHLSQVLYDLEVGDAVTDIYKALNHKNIKEMMSDLGQEHRHNAMNLWLRDVVSGEIGPRNVWESGFRWLRTGLTISSLAWNWGVVALQPLGVMQSMTVLGKQNMFAGMMAVMKHPTIVKDVYKLSSFMQHRSETWNKELIDAKTQLKFTILDKYTPGKTAHYIRDSFFYGIKKAQQFTDVITWIAAQRKGLQDFDGDVDKAIEYADRMVVRSQASGIFGDRSATERGTIDRSLPQTEFVRAFTPFISYLNTKLNIAYERTKKTNFKNPAAIANWAADMTLLYVWEGMAYLIIKGQWPDEDDDETITSAIMKQAVNSFLGGIPFVRELSTAAQGFTPGGAVGGFAGAFGDLVTQISQGEVDDALFNKANRVGGWLFHYPSVQINRTISGIKDINDDDSTIDAVMKVIMGPEFK